MVHDQVQHMINPTQRLPVGAAYEHWTCFYNNISGGKHVSTTELARALEPHAARLVWDHNSRLWLLFPSEARAQWFMIQYSGETT